MSKLMSSVLKPFARIVGAVPSQGRIPEGYEARETGTQVTYTTGGGYEDTMETISEAEYERRLAAVPESTGSPFDMGGSR